MTFPDPPDRLTTADAVPEIVVRGVPGRIDPESISTPEEWVAALVRLKDRTGVSVRDLARATGGSASTIGGYFSGRHLPTTSHTALTTALLGCLGVPAEDRPAWIETLARLRRRTATGR